MRTTCAAHMFALALTCGCDPAIDIEGRVLKADGSPVSGAVVDIECPGRRAPTINGRVLTSDDDGNVRGVAIGCLPRSCSLRARAGAGVQTTVSVADACLGFHWYCKSTNCNRVRATLQFDVPTSGSLAPQSSATGSSAGANQ